MYNWPISEQEVWQKKIKTTREIKIEKLLVVVVQLTGHMVK
jgi:hypothetical protein